MNWADQEILITGGTGSLGRALIKYLIKEKQPKGIRIFSRDEFKQSELKKELHSLIQHPDTKTNISFLIGDIRDHSRLKLAMEGCTLIIHTAALKQIGTCEINPLEAIATNVMGSANVLRAALDCNVKRVIGISSDKACYPINLYGATKLCMEKLFIDGNVYSKEYSEKQKDVLGYESETCPKIITRYPKFAICRYGNVAGSRGSVIPLFKEQYKKDKKITITDERMTRFWMTLNDAVKFVIDCIEMMGGGEIFIPKLPSIRIWSDLLNAMFKDQCKVDFIGIREGEKLHETLITQEENKHLISPEEYLDNDIFVISKRRNDQDDSASYNSHNNHWYLTVEEIKERLIENDLM